MALLLLDNGSKQPGATRNLRRLAQALSRRRGEPVHPVSLQHSDEIPASELDGVPADTLEPFLKKMAQRGERRFVITPLFFGPSRAIEVFVPEVVRRVTEEVGPLTIQVAQVLCPLPDGEPRLAEILEANVRAAVERAGARPTTIIVVDHGSPLPAVSAVRGWLADELGKRVRGKRLLGGATVEQAVMERRPGRSYDFNGQLLAERLAQPPSEHEPETLVLAMQFISPGRHAGPGGDIANIVAEAQARLAGRLLLPTPLIGDHPLFLDILDDRTSDAVNRLHARGCQAS